LHHRFHQDELRQGLYKGKEISNRAPNQIANLGVTRTFQIMRPYYSLPAYKNLVIPLLSPRARRTGVGEEEANWETRNGKHRYPGGNRL